MNPFDTDAEYQVVLTHAKPLLQAAMEISYCCAARKKDVLEIRRQDLREEGIYIKQSKAGKEQIKRWTPRLRQAVDLALFQQKNVKLATWVFVNQGGCIPSSTFDNWFIKARKEAQGGNPNMKFDFTFHDIKGKGVSDYEGNKQEFSGHKNPAQVTTYDRKVKVVDSLE